MIKSKKRVFSVVAAVALLVLVLLFLLRGVIRSEVIPAVVSTLYRSGVGKNFDREFAPVNDKLAALGFTFGSLENAQHECDRGGRVLYEGLDMSVACFKTQESYGRELTPDFAAHWKQNSKQFEQYLQDNGWHKEWNAGRQIDEIYHTPPKATSESAMVSTAWARYSKIHGKTACELLVIYDTSRPAHLAAYTQESCRRTVAPFGSY